jgi:hypothetical protein
MKTLCANLLMVFALVCSGGAAETQLDQALEKLRPFLGTWRGEFKGSTAEKPIIDVAHWERALNGKAIKVTHSINDGAYGGETFITWDAGKKSLVYYYFTTAGFMTKGTMRVDGKKLECHEHVAGSANGATEVKSTYELRDDGSLHSAAKYFKDGNWDQGREVTYKPAPDARPIFK